MCPQDDGAKSRKLPPGWRKINADYLDQTAAMWSDPTKTTMLRTKLRAFLSGGRPNWDVMAANVVKPFPTAETVSRGLIEAANQGRGSVAWSLTGASGSGKSTAFFHIVKAYVRGAAVGNAIAMVWEAEGAAPDAEIIDHLAAPSPHRVLVAVDAAGGHLDAMLDIAESIQAQGCTEIDLLFVCNRSEWERAGSIIQNWNRRHQAAGIDLSPEEMRYFGAAEAIAMTGAYSAARLCQGNETERSEARKFLIASKGNAIDVREGLAGRPSGAPLLGALLCQPRTRDAAKRHIDELLAMLDRGDPSGVYRATFTEIAALGIEGLGLPVLVLAQASGSMTPAIVAKLRYEALVREEKGMLYTRHMEIATAVFEASNGPRLGERLAKILEVADGRTDHGGLKQTEWENWKAEVLRLVVEKADAVTATAAAERALKASPKSALIRARLAAARFRNKDIEGGIDDLCAALRLETCARAALHAIGNACRTFDKRKNSYQSACTAFYFCAFALSGAANRRSGRVIDIEDPLLKLMIDSLKLSLSQTKGRATTKEQAVFLEKWLENSFVVAVNPVPKREISGTLDDIVKNCFNNMDGSLRGANPSFVRRGPLGFSELCDRIFPL